MFCQSCGTQVREGSPFCPNCGARQPDAPQVGGGAPGSTMMYQPEPPAPVQPAYQPPAPQGWQNPAQSGYPGAPGPPPQPAYGGQQQYYPQQQPYPPAQPPYYQQPGYPPGQPYYGQPGVMARPSQNTIIAALLMVAGGALIAISPFLAWAKASVLGRSETESFADYINDTDKSVGLLIIIFVIAAAAVIGGALRYLGKLDTMTFSVWAAVTGIAGVGEAIYQFVQFNDTKSDAGGGIDLSLSVGYYLLVLGCVLAFVALFVGRTQRRV